MSNHVLRRVAIAPIRIYQQVISPLLPDACIYYPTCSQYAVQQSLEESDWNKDIAQK